MADSPAAAAAAAALPGETPTQTKARLRRERLAAKSGASRLQKITALQGGPPRALSDMEKDVPVKPTPAPSSFTPSAAGPATPDPDEIDISAHHFQPVAQPRRPSPFAFGGDQPAAVPGMPASGGSDDPMMAMLQQLMGGGGAGGMPSVSGGSAHQGSVPPGLPPQLATVFSAMQGGPAAEPLPEQSSAWIWRLVHSLFSLALAVYIVLQTPFTGSKVARHSLHDHDWTVEPAPAHDFARFFYLFATFELVMQSSRYFIEKGQLQGSGMLSTVAGILPPPYGGYIRTVGRYSVIWSTVASDAMVVVFVLGATSWWKGGAVA